MRQVVRRGQSERGDPSCRAVVALRRDTEVLGRLGYCPEVLLIDTGVPNRLALYARPVADHVRQQDHLVINHPLCVERLGYTARYGDSSADLESAESPPPVEREKRAIGLRLQLSARSQP